MPGIETEAVIFVYAVLSGTVMFSCYQMLRLFRGLIRHRAGVISAEDLIYWIGISIYIFRQMYYTTYGSIRWYFVLGAAAGNLLAFLTGKELKKAGKSVTKLLKNDRKADKINK